MSTKNLGKHLVENTMVGAGVTGGLMLQSKIPVDNVYVKAGGALLAGTVLQSAMGKGIAPVAMGVAASGAVSLFAELTGSVMTGTPMTHRVGALPVAYARQIEQAAAYDGVGSIQSVADQSIAGMSDFSLAGI
ncbi:MAG: hypothetical protein K0U78_15865 [Actinomycetia bacterium]|nr:hypothetical protein [Actinomycetes bacterium]